MPVEIERKFLVKDYKLTDNETLLESINITQGYLSIVVVRTVRVRICQSGKVKYAYICVKGKTVERARQEFEYGIPVSDAEYMIKNMCDFVIEKVRDRVEVCGYRSNKIWDVDKFSGKNEGLHVAEIELVNKNSRFVKPKWVDKEVTEDSRYFNSNLAVYPFKEW